VIVGGGEGGLHVLAARAVLAIAKRHRFFKKQDLSSQLHVPHERKIGRAANVRNWPKADMTAEAEKTEAPACAGAS
jgi:hypothetical protein